MKTARILVAVARNVIAVLLTGCGNYLYMESNGISGISLNTENELVFHVITCGNSTNKINIPAGREGLDASEPNPLIGSFSLDGPASGYLEIVSSHPEPWRATQPLALPDDPSRFLSSARIRFNTVVQTPFSPAGTSGRWRQH